MTSLSIIGFLNIAVCSFLAFFVLRERSPTRVARSFGLFNVTVVLWSIAYTTWQFMSAPQSASFALRWVLFFGLWPNIAFLYFVFSFEGMSHKRWLMLFGGSIGSCFFAGLALSGHLFSSVSIRSAPGFWGNPTKWFDAHFAFWAIECLFGFVVLLQTARRAEARLKNRMYYVLFAFSVGYIGGLSNWPMWYGVQFPPQLNILVSVFSGILAYAIVKYQIMDIRIAVQTTAVYSIASAFLVALYVGLISIVTRSFEYGHAAPSLFSSALVAIFIALLFHPLRLQLQQWIDRHFPRESLNQKILREATSHFVHEIKRPLVNISMPVQLSLQDVNELDLNAPNRPEVLTRLRERLTFILKQSHEAAEKIEAIRALSLESELSRESVQLDHILTHILAAEEDRFRKAEINVQCTIAANLPSYSGNASQLEIAISNIIRNGVEAMQKTTLPRILNCNLDHRAGEFELSIKDSGPGIASKDVQRLFDPWFTTKGPHGMGIGLYLTQQIIQRHGGTIDVSSELRKGSVFHVSLPHVDGGFK